MSKVEKYGLSKEVFYVLINIFKDYSDIIEKVILFGSRARGDYKETSDIDLAIKFREKNDQITKIIDTLSNEKIIYTIDLIDVDTISNEKLKNYINTEGKVIFLTNSKGEVIDNMNKIMDKLTDLEKATRKLHESLSRDPSQDDIVIDATIQRFEFTYELSWKLMKAFLEYNGHLEVTSPRRTIRVAFKEGLITKGDAWLAMLEDRNKTSHTYDEETANKIYNSIKLHFIQLFDELLIEMKKRINLEL
ncbi:HI0074 family nucleotidyltransferase substrate-binding subunit [Bacillus sp. FJAT-45350]|uniref:HI0074 family nucleotidyltransferase substrate-binding subunit n=1 Tax=Bacillus sp. FJAT-45350 TaxID=2011014 RepID=UPI000BB69B76|nr:HI0074 family nucleotidyltransferase substrate-binding subunit [Bacillus sp. FJAT-45350]